MKKLLSLMSLVTISTTTATSIVIGSNNINSINFNVKKDLEGQKFNWNIKGISMLGDRSMLTPDFNDRAFYLDKYYGLSGDLSEDFIKSDDHALFFENQAVWDEFGSLCGFNASSSRDDIMWALYHAKC